MNKKQLILKALKTKAKAFGFNKKELESVADSMSDNLELDENASDEDVNATIETAVDAVLPFLRVSQSAASRAIQAFKDAHPVEDNDDEDDEPVVQQPVAKKPKKGKQNQPATNDEEAPAWAQALISRLDKIEGDKAKDMRQSRLEKLLANTGTFGTRTLKNFARMNFANDEEFDEFLEEVQNDLEELNQERANDGLSKLGTVPSAKSSGTPDDEKDKVDLMTDEELDKLAKEF